MKKDIVISTGGLGNQLFQIYAALSVDPLKEITVNSSVGTPRLNKRDLPDSSDFEFNGGVNFTPFKQASYVVRKTFNLAVKISVSSIKRKSFHGIILTKIIKFIFCIYFRGLYDIQYCSGVGYTPLKKNRRASIYIGYFQSYKYWMDLSQNREFSTSLNLRSVGKQLNELVNLSKVEKPLVVHMRLGDYRNEPDFGILDPIYFIKAINRIRTAGFEGKIWLFSDEISIAKELISPFFQDIRCIDSVDDSPAATLEAMRLGEAYVISNSTFSWWGAMLSKTNTPYVVVPNPWYINMPAPIDLLPVSWEQIDR